MTTLRVRGPETLTPCGRVDAITAFDSGPAQIAELRMEGDLGGNLSGGDDAIQGFDNVGIVRITGDLLDTINANNFISEIEVLGDVHGDVVALGDRITKLVIGSQQVQGNLYGDVKAPNGDIKRLEVLNGDIGTAQNPVNIAAGQASADRIEYINVPDGDMHADISAYNILKSGTGDEGIHIGGSVANTTITLVNSIRDDFIITGGDFAVSSEINVLHLADAAELKIKKDGNGVGGSILGDMYFTGVLGAQSLIEIDRSLAGNMVFDGDGTSSLNDDIYILGDLGNGEGLTGQIILNADATPLNEGWGDGLVKFGPDGTGQIILDPVPYYNNKSDDLGGGAVGLAPFYCHYKDCTPRGTKVDEASNGEEQLQPDEAGYHAQLRVSPYAISSTVTVRHYGPIKQEGTGKPFTVSRRPSSSDPTTEPWVPVTGSFTHTFPSGDRRAIEITGPFADAHDYLIEPVRDGAGAILACDDLTTQNIVPVMDYDYRIRVFYLQNLNMAGGLEAGDIAAWLLDPADTTLDGTTDNEDLIDVIDAVAEYGE